MRVACNMALMCLLVSLILNFCYCHGKTVEVVGMGECADCADTKIDTTHAVSGLGVTIDCKTQNGLFKTRGTGELDRGGKFKVSLPDEMVDEDGKLKEECFAQLHSAAALPCPAYNGLESTKIALETKTDEGKHTFSPAGKLKFSPAVCTSEFLWPHFKYAPLTPKKTMPSHHPLPTYPIHKKPYPPLFHKKRPPASEARTRLSDPKKLPLPKFNDVPTVKSFIGHHPLPPFPFHKKPLPPLFHKKPLPPLFHKKPLPPLFHKKPLPSIPIYKKPHPPIPNYYYKPKPKVPIIEKHPIPNIPIYKKPFPPIFHKTLPPIPKIPFFHKKPCPPIFHKTLPKIPHIP